MRKKWICVFVFLGIAPFELYSQNEYDFSTVDQILSDSVKTISGFGGGCALLLIKDNQVVYDESFGFFYSTDKIVPIASATKWLSAGVIMSLVDDGLISLDDAVSHYLPNFNGEKGTMTIRQMFSHTAGLPTQSSYIGDLSLTLAQAVDSIAHNVDLKVSPGTGFIYGGVSMHVAGRIAEVATGQDWETLFSERIAQPLGMTGTDYQGLGATDNYRIAGGAQSSAREYANYLHMLLNNGRFDDTQVLSKDAVQEMRNDQTFGVPILETPYEGYRYLDPMLPEIRYGIGNWIERKDTLSGQSVENSSQGAFGFSPWIDLDRNLIGVLSVKSLLPRVAPTYFKLKKHIRAAIDSVANPTSVMQNNRVQHNYHLYQNYPNPFNAITSIRYAIQQRNHVTIKIFNIRGEEVKTLVDKFQNSGIYAIKWNAEGLPGGLYFCRLRSGNFTETRKLIFQK